MPLHLEGSCCEEFTEALGESMVVWEPSISLFSAFSHIDQDHLVI